MSFRFLILLVGVFLIGMRPAAAVSPKAATGAAFAASDGRGEIRLVWFPPLGKWPAGGWRVQEAGSGKVVADHIRMADPKWLAMLDPKAAEAVSRLPAAFKAVKTLTDTSMLYGMVGAQAFGNWDYAQAVGLALSIKDAGQRARSYRVVGLDQNGRPGQPVLLTHPVNPAVATALPAPPTGFKAEAVDGGVALYWQPPAMDRQLPILAYSVERSAGNVFVPATERPVIRARRWDATLPALVDRQAPLETELTYRVHSVDLFGWQGPEASFKFYAADLAAMQPPFEFSGEAGRNEANLKWTPSNNPHVAGYVLERSFLSDGPFEAVTPKGLHARDSHFTDSGLQAGSAYYYRLRVMGPRGDLGLPSRLVMVQPRGSDRPDSVTDLKADVGRTRVHLSWQPLKSAVAGYMVERRDERGGDWLRLQDRPQPEPFYDDYIGTGNGGSFSYRVVAIGYDSQEGARSSTIRADLPDLVSPPAPFINRIDGADGHVTLAFASPAASDIGQFLVLRSDSTEDAGVVVGDPLPASARQFVDDSVETGKTYWYRLVAVDNAGNRSDPGSAVVVSVGSGSIPAAPKPEASYDAEPFPHAVIRYAAPPEGLTAELQYSAGNQPWLVLAGPLLESGEATHANLPADTIRYRLVFRDKGGRAGQPSESVTLERNR